MNVVAQAGCIGPRREACVRLVKPRPLAPLHGSGDTGDRPVAGNPQQAEHCLRLRLSFLPTNRSEDGTIEKRTGDVNQVDQGPKTSKGPLRLSAFDWEGFVKNGGLFVNLVGGAIAGGIVLTNPDTLPKWMISSVTLLFLSLALAFTRVWKTAREERETSGLWGQLDEVSPRGSGMEQVKDAVFEIPYLFSMVFLPASVVSLQTFAACLVLFYVADNYYNLALVRGIADDRTVRRVAAPKPTAALGRRSRRAAGRMLRRVTGGRIEPAFALLGAALETAFSIPNPHPNSIDRVVLTHFFRRRAMLNRTAIWLLAIVLALALFGSRQAAQVAGIVIVSTLLAMELVAEPFRALGLHYESEKSEKSDGDRPPSELLLWTAPAGAKLDDQSVAALHRIHEETFPPGERQYDVEFMLANAGRHGFLLLLLTGSAELTGSHEVAGYVFLQARPEREIAYLWYLAIDKQRRGQGLGHTMVSLALDAVRDRWPSVRAVFLEAGAQPVRFYSDIGFWWVRDLEYKIPVEGDPESSLRYDPMYYPLRGSADEIDGPFVKRAVLEMARDNFRKRPHDQRWKDLKASTGRMRRVPPESRKDA
jgi:ribosomal protein S18 acetylase RimI-like enzyme